MGDIVGQAVSDAEADMGRVQAAAAAISDAIGAVRHWLGPDTWKGKAATDWTNNWTSLYGRVQGCLNDLPSAETNIVTAVRTQMIQIETHRNQAPSA